MPTTINSQSGPINSIDDINKLSQADAVQTLRAISTQLKGADGKSSKSGVLSLVSAHDGQGLSFERKSFYQVGARSTTRMNDTKEALSTLARQAKLDFNAQSALGNYLFDHKNKVGGREFADLLDTLVGKNADEAAGRNLRPAARWVPKALQDEVFGSKNDPKGRKNPSYAVENFVPDGVKKCQNFNCKYEVKGTNGIRLEGISRSANKGQTNFDISKPLVLAFGGSGMVAEELAYDNALSLKDGVNYLCVNYRGFGGSSDVDVSPATIAADARLAFQHALKQGFAPHQIILHGHGLGAAAVAVIQADYEKGDSSIKLGGAYYDQPMTSIQETAQTKFRGPLGWLAGKLAGGFLGDFGARPYLELIAGHGKQEEATPPKTPTRIIYRTDDQETKVRQLAAEMHIEAKPASTHADSRGEFSAFLDKLIPPNNGAAKSKPTQTPPRQSVADSSDKEIAKKQSARVTAVEKRFDDASLPAGFKGRNLVYGKTASGLAMYEYELGTGKGMEKVQAHSVPGIDGARYYLEAQQDDNCTVHSANAALALMTGGLKYLITKGEMRDYAASQGENIQGSFPVDTYIKMNNYNARTDGRPKLTELKAAILTSGDDPEMIFTSLDDVGVGEDQSLGDDEAVVAVARYEAEQAMYAQRRAQVDAAATVGMTYAKLVNGDLRGQHTIVVHCEKQPDANGPGVYVVLDSMESKPSTVSGACASMSEAIKQVFEQRTGGAGVQVDLFMRAS